MLAENLAAQILEVLHVDGGDVERGEIVDLGKGMRVAERVVDCDRPGPEPLQQILRLARRQGMADRLEEGVAALGVAEGLDVEGHERPSPRQAPKRRSFLVQAEKAWRRSSRFSTASSVSQLSWIERRSDEHTSELQSLMRISYAAFCLKKK